MPPELMQLILQGGASAALTWIVYMLTTGKLVTRHAHDEIVRPLNVTIQEQKVELKELADSSQKAVVTMTETQRAALAEQNKTIELLRALLEQQSSAPTPGRP